MAIANSYPKATPKADDLILGTVTPPINSTQSPVTRNFEIDALADLIVSETSGITGGGTLNTIAMFTPDGQAIGDSIMTFSNSPDKITVSGRLGVTGDFTVDGRAIFDGIYARFNDLIQVNGAIQDGYSSVGTAGQVLSSTGTGVQWIDNTASGTVTGSGTTNTLPIWTDGPNSVLGDSLITQAPLGQGINVDTNLDVTDDFTVDGSIQCNSALTVEGVSVFNDDATFQNAANFNSNVTLGADTNNSIVVEGAIELQGPVKDHSANLPSSDGQILVGDAGGSVTWTDSTDIVSGAVAKLIPFTVTASAGGSSTYSADNNIVEIGWTGGNGTYVLNIPSAATIPYRNIRFVTNSTFPNGASDKVQITAQSGETIDGAAFFEISKQYEGVSLWSNGTEWIVIQAKAH